VRGLRTSFRSEDGEFAAVEDVSFDLAEGEVLGIVGESGSGKSVTALSILRLIPNPPGRIAGGEVLLGGQDLLKLPERRMREIRGAAIAKIVETIRYHERIGAQAAVRRALDLLDQVGIPSPAQRLKEYPHQLSGGMRQRVMIAIALSCNPRLLLADEPTTALDVTIQAQILELLRSLQERFGMAVILITHDLGVVAEFVDRVIVMYAGRVAEAAGVHPIFEAPLHPYTEGLLGSIPSLDDERARLQVIPGIVPSPFALPPGCRYSPRCPYARDACAAQDPPLIALRPDHHAACIRHTGYRVPASAAAEAP
jgi:peptide/nickel transport system ATP-binding protein/oligopeptide transport system ATP-binding protein